MSTNNFCNILGYTKKELKKLNYREITHPDDLEEHRLNEEKLISNEVSFIRSRKDISKKQYNCMDKLICFCGEG
jgi:PAS domain S-box-containing protein